MPHPALVLLALVVAQAEEPSLPLAEIVTPSTSRDETGATSTDASAADPPAEEAAAAGAADGIIPAIEALMKAAPDAARVAVAPIEDMDAARSGEIERALVAALRDRRREEVLTPARVKAVLEAAGAAGAGALASVAADHVVFGQVVDEGGEAVLRLRLVVVETGAVASEASTKVAGSARQSTANAQTVRGAIARLVDDLAWGIEESAPDGARYARIAVAPPSAQGAARESRLDRFLQAELTKGLVDRGFLVVERERLSEAIQQVALGEALGEEGAPQVGKLLGAEVVVVGAVSEAGDRFVVNARAVSTTAGRVVAASATEILRDNVVVLASGAAETRTAGEAVFRSLVAPGWGQAYNREPAKSIAFGVAGYGGALATVGLGVAAAISWRAYSDYDPRSFPGSTLVPAEQAAALRQQTNALLALTGVAAGVTAAVWGAGALDALLVGMAAER